MRPCHRCILLLAILVAQATAAAQPPLFLHPFSADSPWNTTIPANAAYFMVLLAFGWISLYLDRRTP